VAVRPQIRLLRAWAARRRPLRLWRSWLARAFGVPGEAKAAIVVRMLEGHARSGPAYWLQLVIALSLATLGLVLNGPAVVIGAMLVSPLMGPIVELGMGLAVGSPLISIRSIVRTFWSVVVVIAGSTFITAALPFHQMTAEVAARTSPTALDLLVAVFCALIAAFTTLRSAASAHEGVAAAAGTAVAIALVPPLCVVGFGLGTHDAPVAQGAFLLFTANLCAILLVAALTFWAFGFNLVDAQGLEAKRLENPEPMGRSVRWMSRAFESRYGPTLRVLVPLALVAVVWLPLRRALREVTWEVHTRAAVQSVVDGLPLARSAVRSSISVKHHDIEVSLVVVGRPSEAHALQVTIARQVTAATAMTPHVQVVAVPDLATMEEMATAMAKREVAAAARPQMDLAATTGDVADALQKAWPAAAAGAIRRFRLDLTDRAHPALEVAHLGQPLGPAGQELLAGLLSERLKTHLTIRDLAIPPDPAVAEPAAGAGWLPRLAAALDWVRADQGLTACVTLPPPDPKPPGRRRRPRPAPALLDLRRAALAQLDGAPPARVRWSAGDRWSVQLQTEPCQDEPGR
jgi:uncharacterized hydrophobic protein (TIGR00271 family)